MSAQDKDLIENAFRLAWHEETARNSFERWQGLAVQEGWELSDEQTELIVQIFGSSWYFTRFIFVNGQDIHGLLDVSSIENYDHDYFHDLFSASLVAGDTEQCLNSLRTIKNRGMLHIYISCLKELISLEQTEYALTVLAEATLLQVLKILQLDPAYSEFPVSILGMGRMAGHEMTFGSDLDLIFLYEGHDQDSNVQVGKFIRFLLRSIAQLSSAGSLYEVDMRLRPHGNSGPLVSTYASFMEYHKQERDVWERQMMTRCKPILLHDEKAREAMQQVRNALYSKYDRDCLRREIISMRKRVQQELGSPRGKYEIKRGYGGIMDIDFITHYYQLAYGHEHAPLRECSTRAILRDLVGLDLLSEPHAETLGNAYDFLKRVEMNLRLFDLKSVDSFSTVPEENTALARSMGCGNNVEKFFSEYEKNTRAVREIFEAVVGEV